MLHGYALAFTFEFEAMELNKQNWVIDFGGLKPLKQWLVDTFDHKTLVAADDDELLDVFIGKANDQPHVANVQVMPAVGMEAFARLAFDRARVLLTELGESPRVRLTRVTVAEHEGNSASYSEPM
jgi:6-pyruvoyltetrahydropterin/6-carboxytetrahydropterin synthase